MSYARQETPLCVAHPPAYSYYHYLIPNAIMLLCSLAAESSPDSSPYDSLVCHPHNRSLGTSRVRRTVSPWLRDLAPPLPHQTPMVRPHQSSGPAALSRL